MTSGKAPGTKESDNVRTVAREFVAHVHGGNVSAASRALGLSQPSLREFLLGDRAPGWKMLEALSRVTGFTREQLLSGDRSTHERPDRYPNRAKAIAVVRGELAKEAILRVEAAEYNFVSDRPVWWWVAELKREHDEVGFNEISPLRR